MHWVAYDKELLAILVIINHDKHWDENEHREDVSQTTTATRIFIDRLLTSIFRSFPDSNARPSRCNYSSIKRCIKGSENKLYTWEDPRS